MSAPAGHQGGIVAVGYGGSEAAQLAVRWAADYAAATGLNLRVVHAWVWPVFTKKLGPVKGVAGSGLRHSAEAILAEGVELARAAAQEAAGSAPGAAPPVVTPQETPQEAPEETPPELPPDAIGAGPPGVEPGVPITSGNAPAPPSTASSRPGSPDRCCAKPPGTQNCWCSAAGALAPSWTRWRARFASIWPARHPVP